SPGQDGFSLTHPSRIPYRLRTPYHLDATCDSSTLFLSSCSRRFRCGESRRSTRATIRLQTQFLVKRPWPARRFSAGRVNVFLQGGILGCVGPGTITPQLDHADGMLTEHRPRSWDPWSKYIERSRRMLRGGCMHCYARAAGQIEPIFVAQNRGGYARTASQANSPLGRKLQVVRRITQSGPRVILSAGVTFF
ncbi:hypothetical protein RSAG8_00554, partial [Rhizoctonia solani AG-8 WAC10335]